MFERYIGMDYSGAETSAARLSGLRVYMAGSQGRPKVVEPPHGKAARWSRKEAAEWLVTVILEGPPTLIGIDHGFSFPCQYFELHGLPLNWPGFLDDFQSHWPTDRDGVWVRDVMGGKVGKGNRRSGKATWRRITEKRCNAGSVFHFNVPGVAKATHAGLPWLRFIRQQAGGEAHFWPYDGWDVPGGRSVVVEAYPALYSAGYEVTEPSEHHHDAFSIAAWMRDADSDGTLARFFDPSNLDPEAKKTADIEGWILGVELT